MKELEELQEMEDALNEAKSKRDRLLGKKQSLLDTLKGEYNIKNSAAAKKEMLLLKQKASNLREKITEGVHSLKKYNLL